ncbi:hypothetical protein F4805DRAFT_430640 [Annulohypoxylon moriforme]|nr:hypothetical protein F4805DRAFT_430640 [Annulohypoxylon moriforme]
MSHQARRISDGEFYLPSGRGIYVTTTKNGKPALGRKKKDRLLEDYGFDILGQAFGIPSRIDFEREAEREIRHRKSFTTQSSTPLTPCERPTKQHKLYQRESYPVPTSKKGLRSASTSASTPARIHRGVGSLSSCSSYGRVSEMKDGNLTPANFCPSTTPSPMPSPVWNFDSSTAMSPNHGIPTPSTSSPQGYAVQFPIVSNFPQPQPIIVPGPQTPPFFRHSRTMAPYQEVSSPICPSAGSLLTHTPTYVSPLVAMPLSTSQLRDELGATTLNNSLPLRYSPSEAKKCEEHYNASMKTIIQGTDKHEDKAKKKMKEAKRDIGKRIQHTHFCSGCGRVRSKQYQREHPLERGQIPDRDYCTKCQRKAALVESDDNNDATNINNAVEDHTPGIVTKVPGANCNRMRDGKDICRSCKPNKSRRLSSLSSILTDSTIAEGHSIPTPSISCTEKSDVKILASARGSVAEQDESKRSKLPSREPVHKVDGDAPLLNPGISKGKKLSIPKNDVRIKNPSSVTEAEGEYPKEIIWTPGPNRVLGDTYVNDTYASRKVPPSESRPRFPQKPSSELLRNVRPKVSVQSVSDHPEGASLYSNRQDETSTCMGEEYYYPTLSSETRVPKAMHSNDDCGGYDSSPKKQPTNDAGRSIHECKSPYASVLDSRIRESQRHACSIPRYELPASKLGIPQQERSHRRRVRRHQYDSQAYQRQLREGYMNNSMELKTPHDPDYVSRRDPPLAPTDLSYAHQTTDPYVMSEPSNIDRAGVEELGQEFELMAEEDLMSAAKFYNDMASPIGDPGTSSFPMPSFMTRTEISVESYCSRGRVNGSILPAASYELYETSESDSMVDEEESQAKAHGKISKLNCHSHQ